MWIVTEELHAKPARIGELEQQLRDLVVAVRNEEPGCRDVRFARSAHAERVYLLVSRFDDEAAYIDHTRAAHYSERLDLLMACLEQPPRVAVFEECGN